MVSKWYRYKGWFEDGSGMVWGGEGQVKRRLRVSPDLMKNCKGGKEMVRGWLEANGWFRDVSGMIRGSSNSYLETL